MLQSSAALSLEVLHNNGNKLHHSYPTLGGVDIVKGKEAVLMV